jgi:hypothetical protein
MGTLAKEFQVVQVLKGLQDPKELPILDNYLTVQRVLPVRANKGQMVPMVVVLIQRLVSMS